jgi:hypothetical protein
VIVYALREQKVPQPNSQLSHGKPPLPTAKASEIFAQDPAEAAKPPFRVAIVNR